jgi:hypothetical protein
MPCRDPLGLRHPFLLLFRGPVLTDDQHLPSASAGRVQISFSANQSGGSYSRQSNIDMATNEIMPPDTA